MKDCILNVDKNDFKDVEFVLFTFETDEKPNFNTIKVIINESKEEYNYKIIQLKNKYYIVTD